MKLPFLFCLLATAILATSADFKTLKRTDFGKKLLASIELQLSMEGPVDKILDLLKELDAGLVEEQAGHDDRHADFQSVCEASLNEYTTQIDRAETDQQQAVSELITLNPAISEAEHELKHALDQKAATEDRKGKSIEQREQEHEIFLERREEHLTAISACNLATEQVLQLKSSSFLQKPALIQLNSHLLAVKRAAPAYGGLFRLLLQVASDPQADQDMVVRLLTLIDKLRASFASSLSIENENEATAQQAHEDLVASLDSTITNLTGLVGELQAELRSLRFQKDDSENRKADAEQRIDNFTGLYIQKKTQCDSEQADYDSETARRHTERGTIEEASTMISDRLSGMSDYVSSKVEHIE